MPYSYGKPYKTGMCNRNCEPLLKCPPGSHISSTRRSCVWHGHGDEEDDDVEAAPTITGPPPAPTDPFGVKGERGYYDPKNLPASFNDATHRRLVNAKTGKDLKFESLGRGDNSVEGVFTRNFNLKHHEPTSYENVVRPEYTAQQFNNLNEKYKLDRSLDEYVPIKKVTDDMKTPTSWTQTVYETEYVIDPVTKQKVMRYKRDGNENLIKKKVQWLGSQRKGGAYRRRHRRSRSRSRSRSRHRSRSSSGRRRHRRRSSKRRSSRRRSSLHYRRRYRI